MEDEKLVEGKNFKDAILVLGDDALVTGFRLAGLTNSIKVDNAKQAEEKLNAILTDSKFGIIVLNEKMLNEMDWRLRKKIDNLAKPVIVPVPDKTGASTEGESLQKLVKRAIGIDLLAKKK
ncbi:V-type ATP synthase subunit F [Candidatus Gugararchaeum adminiculabundum]|nr:V-type ATP synthase subunit F [Candidatus Gugararchaeum adminiculabundum]